MLRYDVRLVSSDFAPSDVRQYRTLGPVIVAAAGGETSCALESVLSLPVIVYILVRYNYGGFWPSTKMPAEAHVGCFLLLGVVHDVFVICVEFYVQNEVKNSDSSGNGSWLVRCTSLVHHSMPKRILCLVGDEQLPLCRGAPKVPY